MNLLKNNGMGTSGYPLLIPSPGVSCERALRQFYLLKPNGCKWRAG